MIRDPYIFKAVVDRVNLVDDTNLNVVKGTIDCHAEMPRMALRNVRMLVPNASTSYFRNPNNPAQVVSRQGGFFHLPNPGDLVICSFVDGYPSSAICIGALYVAGNVDQSIPQPDLATPSGISPELATPAEFQRQDAIWMHETGAYIRFRNGSIDPETNQYLGTIQPEFTIHHSTGTEITMAEDVSGNVSISLTAPNTSIQAGARNDGSALFVDPSDPTPAKTILKLVNTDEVLIQGPNGSLVQLAGNGVFIQTGPGQGGNPTPVYIGTSGGGNAFPVLYRKVASDQPIQDINEIGQSNVLFVGGNDGDITQGNEIYD